jgi:hypothetical protein
LSGSSDSHTERTHNRKTRSNIRKEANEVHTGETRKMVRKNAGAVKGYLERRDQSRVEVRGNCVLDNTDPRENRSLYSPISEIPLDNDIYLPQGCS